MAYLSGWALWLIVGFLLLMLELILPGVFLMWWGFAAIIIAAAANVFSVSIQIILWAVLATIFSLMWWKYQRSKDQVNDQQTELNAREHHLTGSFGVIEEVTASGIIRAKFGDTTWKVQGNNLQVGDKVEVLKAEGIILSVRKI